jgi:hypothetical protein
MNTQVLPDLTANPLLILGGVGLLLVATGGLTVLVGVVLDAVATARGTERERIARQSFAVVSWPFLLIYLGIVCLQVAWLAGEFD